MLLTETHQGLPGAQFQSILLSLRLKIDQSSTTGRKRVVGHYLSPTTLKG